MAFQKAVRKNVYVKILLSGPSGSGKTYSALRLATGIAKATGKRIAAVDTESGRIRYYADEFDFDDMQIEDPFEPEKFIRAIQDAVDCGYGVIVLDSLSHEWDYCVKVHSKMPGNTYTNWAKVTPRHDAFVEALINSKIHIIGTVRGKDEYTMEEKNGKQVPKKVGLGYKQRDSFEYEFTATFNVDQDSHVASVMKDNTHLFENRFDVLTEKDGEALIKWAESGCGYDSNKNVVNNKVETEDVKSDQSEINASNDVATREELLLKFKETANKKVSDGVDVQKIWSVISKENNGDTSYQNIKDISKLQNIIEIVSNL